jgi:hypothetical protein
MQETGISATYDLYRLMNKGKHLLCFSGYVSQGQIMSLLALAEKRLRRESMESQVRRKVFNVMIECLQSFCTDSTVSTDNIFMLGKGETHYEIVLCFNCDAEIAEKLVSFLDKIVVMNKDEIREAHKKMMMQQFSNPAMASFYSLLDISLKSGSPVMFDYEQEEAGCTFTIKTVIPYQ